MTHTGTDKQANWDSSEVYRCGYSKVDERQRRLRAERAGRSAELRHRLADRGAVVLRAYGVREAWLFGSVAAGMAGPGSDLDLLVVPVTAADYWPLLRELGEGLGCTLDLYTQDDDPVFVRKVMERGKAVL